MVDLYAGSCTFKWPRLEGAGRPSDVPLHAGANWPKLNVFKKICLQLLFSSQHIQQHQALGQPLSFTNTIHNTLTPSFPLTTTQQSSWARYVYFQCNPTITANGSITRLDLHSTVVQLKLTSVSNRSNMSSSTVTTLSASLSVSRSKHVPISPMR